MARNLGWVAALAAMALAAGARAQDMGGSFNVGGGPNGMDMHFHVDDPDAPPPQGQLQVTTTASAHQERTVSENGVSFKVAYDPAPRGRTLFRVLAPRGLGVRISDNGRVLVTDTVPAAVDARPDHFLKVELFTSAAVLFTHKYEAKAGMVGQLWVHLAPQPAQVAVQMNVAPPPDGEPAQVGVQMNVAAPPAYGEPAAQPAPVAQVVVAAPSSAPADPCLPGDDFDSVKSAVSAEDFSQQKLSVLDSAIAERRLCVAQVVGLLGLFDFGNDKLAALKLLAPKINDRQNDFKIFSAFTFDSEKNQAKAILR